ncbi:hypothetical protein [Fuerstiella marisgermanici]|nr:hypothetical protein [Fuerstiella marisgermanici]
MSAAMTLSFGLISLAAASDSRDLFELTMHQPLTNERYAVTANIGSVSEVTLRTGQIDPATKIGASVQLLQRKSGEFVVRRSVAGEIQKHHSDSSKLVVIANLPADQIVPDGKYLFAVNLIINGREVTSASRVIRMGNLKGQPDER